MTDFRELRRCAGCLDPNQLAEIDLEMQKVYQNLAQAEVGNILLCNSCQSFLHEVRSFQVQCRESLEHLKSLAGSQAVDPLSEEVKAEPMEFLEAELRSQKEGVKSEDESDESLEEQITADLVRKPRSKKLKRLEAKEADWRATCSDCGTTVRDLHELKLHQKRVHGPKNISCDQCQKNFSCNRYLVRHKMRNHTEKFCRLCDKHFPDLSREEFGNHLQSKHEHICPVCAFTTTTRNSMAIHIKEVHKPVEERYNEVECDVCGVKVRNPDRLKVHYDKYHAEKTIPCPHCPELFKTSFYLNKHIYQKHDKKTCEHCGLEVTATVYRKHINRVHEQKMNFECRLCLKQFFSRKTAFRHLFVHSTSKENNCNLCGYGTCDPRVLVKHYESKHSIVGSPSEIKKMMIEGKPDVDESNIVRLTPVEKNRLTLKQRIHEN